MRGRTRIAALAAFAALALLAAGCGEDDFDNEQRPPQPIEVTAKVDGDKVRVSPSEFGAGLVIVTIANLTDEEVQLSFEGPTSNTTAPIVPRGVEEFKVRLDEGSYEVSSETADVASDQLEVGPQRPSAQNKLLLP